MAELGGANIEIAHKLNEKEDHAEHQHPRWFEALEIAEAIVLALVAIATAWSGYQASQWDGRQDQLYEQSTRLRVEAEGLYSESGQERLYDASTVMEWIKAKVLKQAELVEVIERRFRPEFRVAFEAWKKTDPLNNLNAPPGPMMMPEYHNAKSEESVRIGKEAVELFEQGTLARETSDKYVRVTVVLATVLLLTAISQRFRTHAVRVGLTVLAFLLLCIPLWRIIVLPRI